tara:strand:+ start:841 stop:1017 length:177 start_codon:yes stop_codon:yes gene_type:complete
MRLPELKLLVMKYEFGYNEEWNYYDEVTIIIRKGDISFSSKNVWAVAAFIEGYNAASV